MLYQEFYIYLFQSEFIHLYFNIQILFLLRLKYFILLLSLLIFSIQIKYLLYIYCIIAICLFKYFKTTFITFPVSQNITRLFITRRCINLPSTGKAMDVSLLFSIVRSKNLFMKTLVFKRKTVSNTMFFVCHQ